MIRTMHMNIGNALHNQVDAHQWHICRSETCMGTNIMFIFNHSLLRLASYTFKNLVLIQFEDVRCVSTLNRGHEIPSCKKYILAKNTWVVAHHLTLCGADLTCA